MQTRKITAALFAVVLLFSFAAAVSAADSPAAAKAATPDSPKCDSCPHAKAANGEAGAHCLMHAKAGEAKSCCAAHAAAKTGDKSCDDCPCCKSCDHAAAKEAPAKS